MFARASLREEGGKGVILGFGSIRDRQSSVRLQKKDINIIFKFSYLNRNTHLQPMLHAVEFPASIAHLDSSLANMHR